MVWIASTAPVSLFLNSVPAVTIRALTGYVPAVNP